MDHRTATELGKVVRPTPAAGPWADQLLTVGVTGTNGKTSTTLLVAAALEASGRRTLADTTIGHTLGGSPLQKGESGRFMERIQAAVEDRAVCAALEVTSEALAAGWAKRWRFDLGVFTNLSPDHQDAHRSFEHYLASKAQLFLHLGPGQTAVLNAADPSALLIDQVTPPDVRRFWYGSPSRGTLLRTADLATQGIQVSAQGTVIQLAPSPLGEALGGRLEVSLVGQVFAENTLAAAGALLHMGLTPREIGEGLRSLAGVPGRFEVVAQAPLVAVDYAHTPDALARTCDTAREIVRSAAAQGLGDGRVIVVFGAGGNRDRTKRRPMGEAVGKRADLALVTSDNPRDEPPRDIAREVEAGARRGGRARVIAEPDRSRAIGRALEEARPQDVVVVAGKGHETGQIIRGVTLPFNDAEEIRRLLAQRSRLEKEPLLRRQDFAAKG